jgi:hypothetical protein
MIEHTLGPSWIDRKYHMTRRGLFFRMTSVLDFLETDMR